MTINQNPNLGVTTPLAPPAVPVAAPAAAAPEVKAPVAAEAKAPAVVKDENKAAAAQVLPPADVKIDQVNLDMKELNVLDQLFEQFIGDGDLSQNEMKMFQDLRTMLGQPGAANPVGGAAKSGAANPVGGAAKSDAANPVGGASPNRPSWDYGQAVVNGRTFSSVGDPHETTGDGGKFDNMKEGNFLKARSASGDFELQTVQGKDKSGRWPNATVNHAAAVKAGKDTVAYNGLTQILTINGKPKTLAEGENFKLPDGGSVANTKDGYTIKSPAGDRVDIRQGDKYIDVSGEIGPNRKDGEVRGSLGNFDADKDAANDLVGRDGKVIGAPKDKAAVDKFIEAWRTKPGENLFGADPIGGAGPGKGDTAEVKGDKEAFDKLDANDDNVIDGKELKADVKKYDLDKNGKVDLMEFLKGRDGDRKAQGPVGGAAQAPAPGPAKPFNLDQSVSDMLTFMQMDGKNDGVIYGKKAAPFQEFNTDGAKGISLQEYLVAQAKKRGDFDPKVNYAALAVAGREFVAKDTQNKKDGLLKDGTTLREYVKKRMDEVQPAPNPKPTPQPGPDADTKGRFAQLDRNKDGKLQMHEWQGFENELTIGLSEQKANEWQRLDTNRDGTLSLEEFAKKSLPNTKLPTSQQLEVLNNLRDLFLQDGRWSPQDQTMYSSIRKALLDAEAAAVARPAGVNQAQATAPRQDGNAGVRTVQQGLQAATAAANALVQQAAAAPPAAPDAGVQAQFTTANQRGEALVGDADAALREVQAALAAANQPVAR